MEVEVVVTPSLWLGTNASLMQLSARLLEEAKFSYLFKAIGSGYCGFSAVSSPQGFSRVACSAVRSVTDGITFCTRR